MELDTRGQPFDLEFTLFSGQAFRWAREKDTPDSWFSGVVQGNFIRMRQTNQGVEFRSTLPEGMTQFHLQNYFRLEDDAAAIYEEICHDWRVEMMVREYWGLRLLRQEPWECLIAFLCAADNSVAQTAQTIERLAETLGNAMTLDGETRYSFPTPERLLEAGPEGLAGAHLGPERAAALQQAAQAVASGALDLYALADIPYIHAKNRLLRYPGVTPQIADAVLLFSLDKFEAFPIDRFSARALAEKYFPGQEPPEVEELPDWTELFQEHFGRYAGYAGQFLFHGIRMGQF